MVGAGECGRRTPSAARGRDAIDVLRVQVRDDGRGGATLAGGTGLLGLKDRIEALGGRLLLDSTPKTGTTLHLQLPLSEAEHAVRGLG